MGSREHATWKRRLLRRLLLVLAVLGLLGAALVPRASRWLAQRKLARHAAGRLELAAVRLSRDGSIQLLDVRIARGRAELARVAKVTVRGAAGLLSSEGVPDAVILERVRLSCVVAERGVWRFVLPFRPPARRRAPWIELHDVTFVLPNGDRFKAPRLTFTPAPDPAVFQIDGTVRTPAGEVVAVRGRLNRLTAAARLELVCDRFDLSLRWLRRIPAVAQRLQSQSWRARGYASTQVQLVHAPNSSWDSGWSYECRLDLRNAMFQLPVHGIAARNLVGRVLLKPDRVELTDLSGSLGHGAIQLTGTLGDDTALLVTVRGVQLGDVFAMAETAADRFSSVRVEGSLSIRGGRRPESWTGRLVTRLVGQALPGGALEIVATIDQGHVTVEQARWQWAGGSFALSAEGHLGHDLLELHLTAQSVRLDALLELAGLPARLNALVQAQLHLKGPLTGWNNPTAWALHGGVQLINVETVDRVLGSVTATLSKEPGDGELKVTDVAADVNGILLEGTASLMLAERAWRTQLRTPRPVPLSLLLQYCPPDLQLPDLSGTCTLAVSAQGSAMTGAWSATVAVSDGQLRWNNHELHGIDGIVQLASDAPVTFRSGQLAIAGGRISLEGTVRLEPDARELDIQLALDHVRAEQLLELLSDRPSKTAVAGSLSGTARIRWDCNPVNSPACAASLTSDKLRIDKLTVYDLSAFIELRNGRLAVPRWEGQLARFGPASGRLRWPAGDDDDNLAIDRLVLKAIDLSAITPDRHGRPLCTGMATAELAGHMELSTRRLVLHGVARSAALRWRGLPPAQHARAEVFVDGPRLRLRNLRAVSCAGNVVVDIDHPLDRSASSEISVRLQDVSLNELVSVRKHHDAAFISGIVNGSGTITVKHGPDRSVPLGYGEFTLSRARLARVPVRHAKGVLYYDGKAYDVVFDQMAVGNGSADGTVTVVPGTPTQYRISLAFRDLSLPFLCTSVLRLRDPVAGFVTGSIELEGTSTGWHTTNGAIYITQLRDAELWKLPLFYAIAEFLLPGVTRPGVFHYGKGKIGVQNGVFVLDGFALRGAAAQIYIRQGRIWPDGRLELEIIGNAETLLPAQVPVVGVIRRFADNVQHRLVKFYVTGTVHNPRVRAVPLADVSGPALQFFRELMSGRFLPNPNPGESRR